MTKEVTVTTDQIRALEAIAKYAASSKHFANLGGEAGIFCIAMYAQELGLPVMSCLFGGMKPVLGNIEISPRMMNAMIRKAGHRIEILESTGEKCTIKGTRHDTKETYTCSFTLDDARRAGLVRSGGGYEKWASDMLFARCLSRLCRRLFADVISTAYVEGEIIDSRAEEMASEPVIETVTVEAPPPAPVIAFDDFKTSLAASIGKEFDSALMMEYLLVLEKERKVSIEKIMIQALRKELTVRFFNGFQTWLDAKTDSEALDKS